MRPSFSIAVHASFKSDVLKYQNIMNLQAFKISGDSGLLHVGLPHLRNLVNYTQVPVTEMIQFIRNFQLDFFTICRQVKSLIFFLKKKKTL